MDHSRIAICYDFDKTLCRDDMQSFTFIRSVGMDNDTFWRESNIDAIQNHMDRNLAWMKKMIDEATRSGQSIQREAFEALGRDVKLYRGVKTWFDRVNRYGKERGITVEHYVISSGLKEIIQGCAIAGKLSRIYASTFLYNEAGSAVWPAQVVNYTNKTQFIFRIAKGVFDENDDSVNQSMEDEAHYLPYRNMVYIGDSDTDIPSMRVVKNKGGLAIGVYDPVANRRKKVYDLFREDRIDFFAPADYASDQPLFRMICKIIDWTVARQAIAAETLALRELVAPYDKYNAACAFNQLCGEGETDVESVVRRCRQEVEGNIDG
ncbi:MAG TPA: HAD family hydrolase [Candidatus Limiplasma sp.]|nr:HAD family hydrolase [Candidatus Limiplasma sp.]HPS82455.1 HAD family hydrolase [Candidatus Limiplasma sp.]